MKTVNELIDELKGLPGHLPIVMSSDAEGNRYEYMFEIEHTRMAEDLVGNIEHEWSDDGEVVTDPPNVVVFYPVG